MKKAKTKKIGLLLAMLTFLTLAVFFLPGAKPAAADGGSATYADLLNCNQTFQWVDYAHISCQLSDKKPIVFSKSNPDQNDGSGHYVFAPPPGVFDGPDPALTFEGVQDEGLVVQTNNNWTVLYFNEGYLEGGVSGPQSFIAKYNPINLQLYGGADGISGGHGGAPIKPSAHSISSTDSRSAIVLQGTADGAQSLPDVTSGKFAGYNFVRWKSDYDPSVKGAKVYLFAQNIALNNLGQDCTGDILAVTADSSDNSAGAREYTLGRQGDPLSTYSDLNNLPKDQTRNCRVSSYNFGSGDIAYPTQIYISPAIQKMGKIGEQNVTGGGTGSSGSSDTASSCISDSGLSWIVCPVINGLSESADVMNGFIEGQLNFSVQDNLGGSVHSAWTIFRTLTSIILVIVMLVMVFSQAIGGGPFDAYTVRKLLPKLVAAIILIQISWPLCLYAIQLANDAGQAIGQLMAAPFGGPGALELGSLLKRWNEAGGIIVGIGATGLGLGVTISEILTGGFLIKLAWPILTLAALLILIAVLTDFAVLLIRNALIVLLVMTAPLAFIAYVMPGMETYWKKWRENFIRVLFFFPLLIAIIYGGRIFAWVVGGLGTPGPLDLIMILVAFFGPYFFLPKAFKWAGPGLAAAANAVTNSWPISKGREAAKKGLMDRQQRGLDAKAKELNPDKEGYAKARRFGGIPLGQNRKLFRGLPYGWSGNLSRTAVENLAAGRVIPTKRGLGAAVKRGDDWKANEEALDAARVKRGQDKAAAMTADEVAKYNGEAEDLKDMDLSSVPYTYRLDKDGNVVAEVSDNPTARSKASILNDIGNANPQLAGMAVDRALKTQSWIELMKNLTAITDEDLKEKIKASGAEYWEGNPQDPRTAGKLFVRPHDVPRFASKINSSEDLYVQTLGKALLTTPHISNPEGKSIAQMQKDEIAAAKKENRQPRELVSMTSMQDPQLRQLQKAENEAAEREKRPARNLAKPLEQLQAEENEAAQRENRPARKVVRPHHLSRALEAIHGYLDAGNITGQSEAEYAEFARLAEQDPEISVAFGQLLHRIAHGGQGGINVLTQLGSSSSMQGTMKSLLGKANVDVQYDDSSTGRPVTHHGTIEEYLDEGRTAMAAQSQPVQQGASGAVGNVGGSTGRQQTGGTGGVQPVTQIINQNDGGTLVVQQPEPQVIQLQPGQVTSPGGVILSRATQDDLNSQFEIMRRELRDLKKMGQRTQEQQQRLEEIQAAHPDWKDEDEDDDEQNT